MLKSSPKFFKSSDECTIKKNINSSVTTRTKAHILNG